MKQKPRLKDSVECSSYGAVLAVLASLNARSKWFETKRKFKEDAVVIVTPDAKRREWPISRVVKTHLGKDELVRVVDI